MVTSTPSSTTRPARVLPVRRARFEDGQVAGGVVGLAERVEPGRRVAEHRAGEPSIVGEHDDRGRRRSEDGDRIDGRPSPAADLQRGDDEQELPPTALRAGVREQVQAEVVE
jgi:hypothetical protein